jgi:hypothetical protein
MDRVLGRDRKRDEDKGRDRDRDRDRDSSEIFADWSNTP